MPTPTIVQKGVAVEVGFKGITYLMLLLDDSSEKPIAELGFIADDNDNDATMLKSDVGRQYTLNGVIKAAGTELATLRGLDIGDLITINGVNCGVVSVDLKFQRLEATGSIVAENVPAITYA
jgi:hypothetical protein